MRIEVDLDRCQGFGICVEAAPEVFGLDQDEDQVVLRQVQVDDHDTGERADLAARSCPMSAIHLH